MYRVTGIVGLILAVAPWLFGYSDNRIALWASVILGLGTVIVSWMEGRREDRERWEYLTAALLGIIAVIAPFVLGYSHLANARWSSVIAGILIAAFAGSRLTTMTRSRTGL